MEKINFCKCGKKIITDNKFNFVICQNCYEIKFYNERLDKQLDKLIEIREKERHISKQINLTIKTILALQTI